MVNPTRTPEIACIFVIAEKNDAGDALLTLAPCSRKIGYCFRRMTRPCLRNALLAGALLLASPGAAWAQQPPAQTEDQAKAQQHFQRAKDLYQQGSYREAIQELELARSLDPAAKDLVFNLGVVHEKLGRFDEAIVYFRQYMDMEGVTAQEKTKAESIIKRIQGAKREVPTATAPPRGDGTAAPPDGGDGHAEDTPQSPPEGPRGRIDAATIAAGSVAVVGLGVGTVFGIQALSTRPSDFVTGRDGSFVDFQQKNDDAHTAALIADVGFGVGIVAALATAWLYFGRTKDTAQTGQTGVVIGPAIIAGTFR